MKKIISLCVALGSCLLASCGYQTESTVSSTYVAPSISLDCSSKTVYSGETFTLVARTSPETNDRVVWSSSDTNVASVANGVVTAKSGGKATIIASYGGASATCLVEVLKSCNSLRYDYSHVLVQANTTFENICRYTPVDMYGDHGVFTSSQPSVCRLAESPKYNATSAGFATITCKSYLNPNVSATFDCVVVDASLKTANTKYSHILRSYEIDAIKTNSALCDYSFNINGSILSTQRYTWLYADDYLTKAYYEFLLLSYYVDFGDGVLFNLGEKKFSSDPNITKLDDGYYVYYFSFYCSLSKIKALSGKDYVAGFNFIIETRSGYEWVKL